MCQMNGTLVETAYSAVRRTRHEAKISSPLRRRSRHRATVPVLVAEYDQSAPWAVARRQHTTQPFQSAGSWPATRCKWEVCHLEHGKTETSLSGSLAEAIEYPKKPSCNCYLGGAIWCMFAGSPSKQPLGAGYLSAVRLQASRTIVAVCNGLSSVLGIKRHFRQASHW